MFYSNNFSSIRGDTCDSHSGSHAPQVGGFLNHMGFTPYTDKEPGDHQIHESLMGGVKGGKNPQHQVPGWKDGFGSGRLTSKGVKGGSTGNKALQAAEIPSTSNSRSLKGSGAATKKNTKGGYIFKR